MKRSTLKILLAALVAETSRDTIFDVLHELELKPPNGQNPAGDKSKKRHKLSAIERVRNLVDLPEEKGLRIIEIAKRFDDKAFLPSIADVRDFLAMYGVANFNEKDRLNSFGKVLPVLQGMSLQELDVLTSGYAHLGASELGPLSAAIENLATNRPTKKV